MKKKLLSMFLAAAMALTAFSVPIMAAEGDTVVYDLNLENVLLDAGKQTIQTGEITKYGIKVDNSANHSWTTPEVKTLIGTTKSLWLYSARKPSGYTAGTEQLFTTVNMVNNDTENILDSGTNIVKYEFRFGVAVRAGKVRMEMNATDGTDEYAMSNVVLSKDSSGDSGTVTLGETSTKYTKMYASNVDYPVPAYFSKLTAYFDMQNKTATIVLNQNEGPNVILAENMPFEKPYSGTGILKPSNLKIHVTDHHKNGYDQIVTTGIKTTILSDQTIADDAIASLSIPQSATTNLTLPVSIAGADIDWVSDKPDVIAKDGTVTRPGDADATVTLTATATRGTATATQNFTVTVPANAEPMSGNTADANAPEGQLMMDEMPYPNAFRMPTEGDYSFTTSLPDDTANTVAFVNDAVTATVTEKAALSADGEALTFIKKNSGAYFAKWLSTGASTQNSVIEWEYETIGNPYVLFQLESQSNWRGTFLMYDNRQAAGTDPVLFTKGGGKKSSEWKNVNKIKVTLYTDYANKKIHMYVNDKFFETMGFISGYDAQYYNTAKMRITLNADKTPNGDGVKINYIHMYDAAQYGANSVSVDKTALEAAMPDKTATVNNGDTIALFSTVTTTGNTITWTSDDNTVINPSTGAVSAAYEDKIVKLTAAIENASGAKDTVEYTYTVPKTTPQIVEGDTASKVTAQEGLEGNAVGFYGTAPTSGQYQRSFGFRLSEEGKNPWDIKITMPAAVEGGASVKYGLVLEANDGTDLSGVTAKTIYKDIPDAQ